MTRAGPGKVFLNPGLFLGGYGARYPVLPSVWSIFQGEVAICSYLVTIGTATDSKKKKCIVETKIGIFRKLYDFELQHAHILVPFVEDMCPNSRRPTVGLGGE